MGAKQAQEIDAWLRDGGVVITASDRAARAITAAYQRNRLAEGHKAWEAPAVLDWQRFAREQWERRATDGRLVLNPLQERAIWSDIVAGSGHAAATLAQSRHRLAAMAMDAHGLICSYAPRLLDERARNGWINDAAAFNQWLVAFDDVCESSNALSTGRVPLELIPLIERDNHPRSPLLLAGFDRLLPVQDALFAAWGDSRLADDGDEQAATRFYSVSDADAELTACAIWCRDSLAKNPQTRLLVVTQDAAKRRGEIERALLQHCDLAGAHVEFSLGVSLGGIAIARSAMLLLRWLTGSIEEHELDWLIAGGHFTRSAEEASALQSRMRDLRRHGLQRTLWTLETFIQERAKPTPPVTWLERITSAQRRLSATLQRKKSPLEWAELAPLLLNDAGWPGPTLGSSAEFQAAQRLQQVVDLCGSLGFDGRRIAWQEFLTELERALQETLFSAESQDAPILIAGPSESAGLTANAIWFLGASEDAWPASGSLHSLIPAGAQRQARMPHSAPQLDWELAVGMTERLLASAPQVRFSYPRQVDGVDGRPSRIIAQVAGKAEQLPNNLIPPPFPQPITICVEDQSLISLIDLALPRMPIKIRGGSRILTAQSQCGFRGFALGRLGAEEWDPAEAGLTPRVRGQLLHAALREIWAGPPNGISTLCELQRLEDRHAFVAARVLAVFVRELPDAARQLMPQRYLELEAERLIRLVSEWLDYEMMRLPFTVAGSELTTTTTVGRLNFDLRLDRIDLLNDGSFLVIDYKTGDVSPRSWDLPRPDDVQLPLYAGFALESGQELGGLVFAKIRAGDVCFTGKTGDPAGTLGLGLKNIASLKKNQLDIEDLINWRNAIEQLARDYSAGRADVNPRDPIETCKQCGLQTLCRVHERPIEVQEERAGDADE